MDDPAPLHPALLPAGLRDLLPPDAQTEAASVEALMAVFADHGYLRVKPPLLEFEDSLLAGAGAGASGSGVPRHGPRQPPHDGAAGRHHPAGRPHRRHEAGRSAPPTAPVLRRPVHRRVRAQRETDRQVPQAGIELIGADSAQADAEAMLVAAEALSALGLTRLSLDLTLPTLAPALLDAAGVDAAHRQALARALDRKDAAAVAEHGGTLAPMLTELLLAAGPAPAALAALRHAPSSPRPSGSWPSGLEQVVALISARAPHLRLTVDPLEFRGLRYHTGIAVTVFAPGRNGELGRGGRYLTGDGEPATGVTLFADAVLRAAPAPAARAQRAGGGRYRPGSGQIVCVRRGTRRWRPWKAARTRRRRGGWDARTCCEGGVAVEVR